MSEAQALEGALVHVEGFICLLCLDGVGGECHTPGCAFWVCPAPSAEQASRLRDLVTEPVAPVEDGETQQ